MKKSPKNTKSSLHLNNMFHEAIKLKFKKGTSLEVTFRDGKVNRYDVSVLFDKYPQLVALKNRKLFVSGRLSGFYGIVWNDDLDLEVETVYVEGETVRTVNVLSTYAAADALLKTRAEANISQSELAKISGLDQSDISKIEMGKKYPSIKSLDKIAKALGKELKISIE